MNLESSEVENITVRKGETLVQLSLRRSAKGLLVSAKAHRTIEDLFEAWSDGSTTQPEHGRAWSPNGGASKIELWTLVNAPAGALKFDDGVYRIDRCGTELVEGKEGQVPTVNLGFLRLKGISEGSGASFVIKGVFTAEEVRRAGKLIQAAIRKLYLDFLRPIDLQITLSMVEAHPDS